jgi:hypothetical protein
LSSCLVLLFTLRVVLLCRTLGPCGRWAQHRCPRSPARALSPVRALFFVVMRLSMAIVAEGWQHPYASSAYDGGRTLVVTRSSVPYQSSYNSQCDSSGTSPGTESLPSSSITELHHDFPRPVHRRFGEVGGFGQVGDGAGEFQHPMIAAGGELQLLDGSFQRVSEASSSSVPAESSCWRSSSAPLNETQPTSNRRVMI